MRPLLLDYYFSKLAEGEGFEPSVRVNAQRFSRPPHSTTLAPLHRCSEFYPNLKLMTSAMGLVYSTRMQDITGFQKDLFKWYDTHQRHLPWRLSTPNPYYTWISEVMLQQTTVPTVMPYFEKFIQTWPTVQELANASLDEVLHAWQGLGYYSRARNLHKCAQEIAHHSKGIFPEDEKHLKSLPGIGDYTAAAIRTIAFNKPAIVMDGNIERILSRLFLVKDPLPRSKSILKKHAQKIMSHQRPGDYAQALMDLGSSVCTPKKPLCLTCPIRQYCKAPGKNPQLYPVKLPKTAKPKKFAILFWVTDKHNRILIEKRPHKGLLAGLMGFPTSPWTEEEPSSKDLSHAPLQTQWTPLEKGVTHTFTHFHLSFLVVCGKTSQSTKGLWARPEDLQDYAFPTLMKKVIRLMESQMESEMEN